MDLTKKIAAAAGALTLGVAGVAAAGAVTPDAAEPGLTKASENVGIELPASHDSHPDAEAGEDDTTADDTTTDVEDEAGAPEDNHGAIVSAVAHSEFETGREHGEAVSAAARDNHGAEVSGDDSGEDELEVDDEEIDDESTDGAEEHEDDADAAGAHARK